MAGTKRANIKSGIRVSIVLKKDQRSGKLTEGVVKDILTNSSTHPHGIKVRFFLCQPKSFPYSSLLPACIPVTWILIRQRKWPYSYAVIEAGWRPSGRWVWTIGWQRKNRSGSCSGGFSISLLIYPWNSTCLSMSTRALQAAI